MGHLQRQLDPGLLHVPLLAVPRQGQGLVERIEPVVAGNAVEIRPLQGHRPEQRLHRARARRARWQPALTLGAGRLLLPQQRAVAAFDESLHQGRGQSGALLGQRLGDLHQGRRPRTGRAHTGLPLIQAPVQRVMGSASKALPLLPLLKGRQRENRSHRSPASSLEGSWPRGRRPQEVTYWEIYTYGPESRHNNRLRGPIEIEASANQSVVGIFDSEGIQNELIYLFFVHEIRKIINRATGGAQQHINKEIVNSVEYLEPPKLLISFFRMHVKPIFAQMKVLELQNINLHQARDLLLPRLMNGEIAV